jgi:hypothetical protein
VRFARQLTAVLLTVAAVAALGVAWAHSAEASWLAGPNHSRVRIVHPDQVAKARQLRIARARRADGSPGLSLSNSGDLISTAVIEAGIAAVVTTASAVRWQHRRARRGA